MVLTVWDVAFPDGLDAAQECPEGLQFTEKDQWLALPASVRAEQNARFGFRWNRGPNGENGITAPEHVVDPLPFREVRGKVAVGFNLDGTPDGSATPRSCGHEKFQSPDGKLAIDNQLYRVLGCSVGMRPGGFQREWVAREFQTHPANRILMEVTDVDDLRQDDSVKVSFYKGYDKLPEVAAGTYLAGSTQHVDERYPELSFSVAGRIVDGVLTTDPIEAARFPILWIQIVGVRTLRDMRMRLALTADGADGVIGGYEDLEEHWQMWRRGASGSQDISMWSGASINHAMHRLADGYPDPATGQCTAISVAYRIKAVRANLIHDASRGAAVAKSEHPAINELRGY